MGATGVNRLIPAMGTVNTWEALAKGNSLITKDNSQLGAIFDANGDPIIGIQGIPNVDKDGNPIPGVNGNGIEIKVPDKYMQVPNGTFTHLHPANFGGTLAMSDVAMFAKSQWGEIRASTKNGVTYIMRAKPGADKQRLLNWTKKNSKLMRKNYKSAYDKALREASQAPIQTGKHKGKIKVTDLKTRRVKYINPMTPAQADKYARKVATNIYDRAYRKALKTPTNKGGLKGLGFEYKIKRTKLEK